MSRSVCIHFCPDYMYCEECAAEAVSESRERFEDYFYSTRKNKPDFTQNADGTYTCDHAQRHWLTWQVALGREYQGRRPRTSSPRAEGK